MKTIRIFLFFALFVASSQNSHAAKVQAKVCVAVASQTATVAKVQQTVSLSIETPAVAESSVMASYHQLTQAYVQGAREQSNALSTSLQNFAAMFTTSRMLWVLAALILLIFAHL